jgi:two-component system sensor histidine kinase UhpB
MTTDSKLDVLLIEDSPTDAILLKTQLARVEELSFVIDHSNTLTDGLRKLGDSHFDALILDLGLPDSLGISTYDKARKLVPKMPIVILTSLDDRDLSVEALRKGADNYLIKDTIDGNKLAVAILSAIRNYQP